MRGFFLFYSIFCAASEKRRAALLFFRKNHRNFLQEIPAKTLSERLWAKHKISLLNFMQNVKNEKFVA